MRALLAGLVCVGLLAWACVAGAAVVQQDDWYGNMEARSGLLWNASAQEWDAYATVPVLGYKAVTLELGLAADPMQDDGPRAAVLGLTYDIGSLQDFGVEVSWAKYISFHVGPYIQYDFDCDEFAVGGMCSVIELSFDQGNVERQAAANK
jgi:hypothetical protein